MMNRIKRVKESLQYTGWLQYIIPVIQGCILLVLAGFFYIIKVSVVGNILSVLALMLVSRTIFDLVVVKWMIRPKEKKPKRKDHLNNLELMDVRRSCRAFQKEKLNDQDKEELLSKTEELLRHKVIAKDKIRLEYLDSKLTVWPVVNAQEFMVAIVPKEYSRRNIYEVGIKLQELVIYATKMGLGTCWIGPGADQETIELALGNRYSKDTEHIICVCAMGYESKFYPLFLSFARRIQRRRKQMNELFFKDDILTDPVKFEELDETFKNVLRATRRAPSSFNDQPVRGVKCSNDRFKFFTIKKSKYYSPVALGIWLANWKMACNFYSIEGEFYVEENQSELPKYEISWTRL